jgi:hypothetical protein
MWKRGWLTVNLIQHLWFTSDILTRMPMICLICLLGSYILQQQRKNHSCIDQFDESPRDKKQYLLGVPYSTSVTIFCLLIKDVWKRAAPVSSIGHRHLVSLIVKNHKSMIYHLQLVTGKARLFFPGTLAPVQKQFLCTPRDSHEK